MRDGGPEGRGDGVDRRGHRAAHQQIAPIDVGGDGGGLSPQDVALEILRNQHDAAHRAPPHGLLCRLEVRASSGHGHAFARVEPAREHPTHGRVVAVHHHDRDVAQHLVEVRSRVEQAVEHRGDAEHGDHPLVASDGAERPERGAAERLHSRPQYFGSRRSAGRRGSASPRATAIVRASARSGRPAVSGAPTVTPARTSAMRVRERERLGPDAGSDRHGGERERDPAERRRGTEDQRAQAHGPSQIRGPRDDQQGERLGGEHERGRRDDQQPGRSAYRNAVPDRVTADQHHHQQAVREGVRARAFRATPRGSSPAPPRAIPGPSRRPARDRRRRWSRGR